MVSQGLDDVPDDGCPGRLRHWSVCDESQLRSSRRFGETLYQDLETSCSGRTSSSSCKSSSVEDDSGELHSSLRSGAPARPTHFKPHPWHRDVDVSLLGNLLIRLEIEEEMKLDND